jgi:hypothetical protein
MRLGFGWYLTALLTAVGAVGTGLLSFTSVFGEKIPTYATAFVVLLLMLGALIWYALSKKGGSTGGR